MLRLHSPTRQDKTHPLNFPHTRYQSMEEENKNKRVGDLEAGVSGSMVLETTPVVRMEKRKKKKKEEEMVFSRRSFLEACFLCKRQLGRGTDIYMYKGEMGFCSNECREEQIQMNEAKERSLKKLAIKASRKLKSTCSIYPTDTIFVWNTLFPKSSSLYYVVFLLLLLPPPPNPVR